MAKARAAVAATKIKKKNWHPILAPSSLKGAVLGEAYVSDANDAVGRAVQFNLADITHNVRDQNAYVSFTISTNTGGKLQTEVRGYYMNPASIKKLSRRSTARIDESFVVTTKDGKRVRVKPVMIAINIIPASLRTALRKAAQQHVAREAAVLNFSEFVEKIMFHKIQSEIKKKISKIYPVKSFEVKVVEFAKVGKAVEASEEAEEEVKEAKPKKKAAKKEKKSVSEEMVDELESEKKLDVSTADDSEEFGEE